MVALGINFVGLNISRCLLFDGELIFALEEERLIQDKRITDPIRGVLLASVGFPSRKCSWRATRGT